MISFDLACEIKCDFCPTKQTVRVTADADISVLNPGGATDLSPQERLVNLARNRVALLVGRTDWVSITVGTKIKLACQECSRRLGIVEVPNIVCANCNEKGHAAGSCLVRRCANCGTRLADRKPEDPVEPVLCDPCDGNTPDPDDVRD